MSRPSGPGKEPTGSSKSAANGIPTLSSRSTKGTPLSGSLAKTSLDPTTIFGSASAQQGPQFVRRELRVDGNNPRPKLQGGQHTGCETDPRARDQSDPIALANVHAVKGSGDASDILLQASVGDLLRFDPHRLNVSDCDVFGESYRRLRE